MRKAFVGITDSDWYEFLSHRGDLSEVNFWQPSGRVRFKSLSRGDLFLFKLHAPQNYIVGGGFFETASLLPVSLAWETFGHMNGVASLPAMRRRIERYRRTVTREHEDYTIGNIVLQQPFFLRRPAWIPAPPDLHPNVVQGKTYDLESGTGAELYRALGERLADSTALVNTPPASENAVQRMFSEPVLARRRLGQGAFRVLVTDTYERQCAITREHTLPVLEAAHIKPVTQGGEHIITNALLFRSDVHTLFDRGYVTVTPDYRFRVSKRLDEDWKNGRIYFAADRQPIHLPRDAECHPNRELLEWHADTV